MVRKSKGRQKVEMVKMHNDSNLQVTFSKRRSGLFKKASELCTLCGAEVVVVVFSPGNKVFSFGHPGVETLIERYVSRSPPQASGTMQLIEAHRNASVRELNMQLTQVTNQLEAERKRGEELNQMKKASQSQCWWENPIDQLNLTQLEQLRQALEELKKNVAKQAEKLLIQSTAPPPPPPPPPMQPQQQQFYMGNPSTCPGGVLPYDPNKNMVNNVGFSANMNMNNMMPPPGFNPGFGRGFF